MGFMEEPFGKRVQSWDWPRRYNPRRGNHAAREAVQELGSWLGFVGRHRLLFRTLAAAAIVLGIAAVAGLLTFGLQIASELGDAVASLFEGALQDARH